MINIDTRFLSKVDESEMWLLLHITKRLGKKMFCFPSNSTLLNDTGWSIDKLRYVKKSLEQKGLIWIEDTHGKSNNYHVKTDEIGVFIGADRLSDTPSEKPTGVSRKNQQGTPSEKPTPKYYQDEVLVSNLLKETKLLEKKKVEFKDTVRPFIDQYGVMMCRAFVQYWGEASKSGKKLRWEMEKTWEVGLRLARWKKNEEEKANKFSKPLATSATIGPRLGEDPAQGYRPNE